jgi:diguanylate cyclase (GGDEF)-like protein
MVCRAFLERIVSSGVSLSGVEYRVADKSGMWHWHTTSAVPYRGESGETRGFYGIARDIDENKRLIGELERQATTDELTGIMNRRHFIQLAAIEFKRAIRQKTPLSIALIDLDRFKEVNDRFGHSVGDRVLVFFAELVARNIRDIDLFSRFGGDEFVLLFPSRKCDQAIEIVERCRLALSATPWYSEGQPLTIEISVGIAFALVERTPADTLDELFLRVDQAMYRAKANGRNTVSLQR